jgi:hypothetical protein
MAHYRTKYETILTAPDGARFLLLYVESRSARGLLDCLRRRGAELCQRIGLDDAATVNRAGAGRFPVFDFGNGWKAGYSGRTRLEAKQAGELPRIFEPAAAGQ